MKIFITNSPSYIKNLNRRFTYGSRFGCIFTHPYKYKISCYTPYMWSMGYASAILKRDTNHEVKALDAQAKIFNDKDLMREIKKYEPDLLIFDLPTVSFSFMKYLMEEIKNDLNCKIAVGGLHVSGLPIESLKENPYIDFVLIGEYELIIKDFVDCINGVKNIKDVPNIFFRKENKIYKTKFSKDPFMGISFDSLPYPDREDMPITEYHDMEINGTPGVQMLTSRGCPHQCKFCCSTVYWPCGAYWQRNPINVVNEMEFVKEKYKPKSVYFDDDIVLPNMLRGIASEIKKRKLDLPWTFMGSINIPEKIIEEASKAGCIGLKYGIESINTNVLDAINKKWIKKERVKEFTKLCKKYNLFTHGTFIIGLPQDNKENLLKTLDFVKELDLDSFQIYTMVPLPGSPFYFEAKKNGWIKKDKENEWMYYDGNSPIMDYPWFPNEEIKEVFDKWIQFRSKLMLKRKLKKPHKLIKNILHTQPQYVMMKVKNILKGAKKQI